MILTEKNFSPGLFCFLIVALTFGGFACGNNSETDNRSKNGTGSYSAKLIFPPEVPRIKPAAQPSVKAVVGGIDCAGYGIATLHCEVRAADNTPLAEADWNCSDRKGVVGSIPPGNGITVVVTANSKNGTPLLRGEDRGVIIEADKNTEGGAINLHPADSPTVVAGGDPKTLVFDWAHIEFPVDVDHYRLEVDSDGDNEEYQFSIIEYADDIRDTEFTLTVSVHLTDWVNALYRVVALDADNNLVDISSDIDLLTSVAPEEVIGYFKAGNPGELDYFGHSVSLSGDGHTLAVGGFCEDGTGTGGENNNDMLCAGAVYIFTRNGSTWSQQAYLKAGNSDRGDRFGESVFLSGDGHTLAVGATDIDGGIGGEINNDIPVDGAVYVFTRTGGAWSQQAYLKAGNSDEDDWFSDSISLSADGNTLAVGAEREDGDGIGGEANNDMRDAGAVYVFARTGSAWSQQAYLKASNPDELDLFGASVSLSGDGNTLAVGARGEDVNGISGEANNDISGAGAVYLFNRSNGTWSQQAYLNAGNPDEGDWFGYSVCLSGEGNTLAVGAFYENSNGTGGEDNNDMPGAGAVYVFARTGSAWSQQAYLKAGNPDIFDSFGESVFLSSDGNTLAVGAINEAGNGTGGEANNDLPFAGAVYVFTRSGNAWSRPAYLKAGSPDSEYDNENDSWFGDYFGVSVSLSNDGKTLAVGAAHEASNATGINGDESNNDIRGAGAVYLF